MRVSVVIPTYNRAGSIGAAVESVLAQSRPADEIIVVDDGSTDDTAAALAAYTGRIVVLSQANGGVSAARNAGIERASGAWVAFLDSDDVWLPNRLAVLARDVAAWDDADAGVHVADVRLEGPGYDESLQRIRGQAFAAGRGTRVSRPLPLVMSGLQLDSIACRRDWLLAAGGFDPALSMFEDLDLLARLALAGAWVFSGDLVARVRRIEEAEGLALTSAAARDRARSSAGLAAAFAKVATRADLDETERRLARKAWSGALLGEARARLATGKAGAALSPLARSVSVHPSWLTAAAKAAATLMLGERRYERLLGRQPGFRRENAERPA